MVNPTMTLKKMMFPARELAGRPTHPRGSVLILVVAVLVLLALMGTAYIATTRTDRVSAITETNNAAVEVLASGVLERIKGDLINDRVATPSATNLTKVGAVTRNDPVGFNSFYSVKVSGVTLVPVDVRETGLQSLASRVPFANGTDTALSAVSVPRWEFISAPLDASSVSAGAFYSPIADSANAGTTFTYALGSAAFPTSTWGATETARHNLPITWVLVNGVRYPAFFTPSGNITLAADADGDGVGDSGYSLLGSLANSAYAGVTFYAGIRVLDNNSAVNVNTAWSNQNDYDFTTATAAVVRNNRLFPSAIGLREMLATPNIAGGFGDDSPNTGTGDYNRYDAFEQNGTNRDFLGSRGGYYDVVTTSALTPLSDHDYALKDYYDDPMVAAFRRPVQMSNTTPAEVWRSDFSFRSQGELLWSQLGRRLNNPGSHGEFNGTAGAANQSFTFQPFSLGDQLSLGYGFVLAQRNQSDSTFADSRSSASRLEQVLPFSLFRVNDRSGSTVPASWGTPVYMRTTPYKAADASIGFRNDNTIADNWFDANFGYETTATTANPINSLNLRPLVVASNPVSQTVTFKPLPQYGVLPLAAVGLREQYDKMSPYIRVWNATDYYNPGAVVFYATTVTDGAYYVNSRAVRIQGTASGAQPAPTGSLWTRYDGTLVPTKVDVNTAEFGDLWRAFYLTMSGDNIDPDETGGNYPNKTVSPFGRRLADGTLSGPLLAKGTLGVAEDTADVFTATADDRRYEIYRGMHFNSALPGQPAIVTTARPNVVAAPTASPVVVAQQTYHPQRMFRSNLKDFSTAALVPAGPMYLPPAEMVMLRSAQAAVNAEYLRKNRVRAVGVVDDSLVHRRIALRSNLRNLGDAPDIEAHVYSAGRFPYITEIYYNNDAATAEDPDGPGGSPPTENLQGYIAVKLFNPYPFDINLGNWKLQSMPRPVAGISAGERTAGRAPIDILTFRGNAVIPAGGGLILENYVDPTESTAEVPNTYVVPTTAMGAIVWTPAIYRPTLSNLPASGPTGSATVNRIYVPQLGAFVGIAGPGNVGEMVLLRPTAGEVIGGVQNASEPAAGDAGYDAVTSAMYAPVDSFDFTNFEAPNVSSTTARAYHYRRKQDNWRFVYPGRYDGSRPMTPEQFRQQGIEITAPWDPTVPEPAVATATAVNFLNTAPDMASYNRTRPLQVANVDFGGINGAISNVPNSATPPNQYPFGGFARELDMLQITFISPVRYRPVTAPETDDLVFDLVSMTQDAAFADDTDTMDDAEENIGRFAPLAIPEPPQAAAISPTVAAPNFFYDRWSAANDYVRRIDENSSNPAQVRYGWGAKLLDNLTVRSSTKQASPVGATGEKVDSAGATEWDVSSYPTGTNRMPQPVGAKALGASGPNALAEYGNGVQGLVNINTAPLPVLAAVPWVPISTATADTIRIGRARNIAIAKKIIEHRSTKGTFKSIFDLNRVLGDPNAAGAPTSYASFRTNSIDQRDPASGALTPVDFTLPDRNWGREPVPVVNEPVAIWGNAKSAFWNSVAAYDQTTPYNPAGADPAVAAYNAGFRTPTNGDLSPINAGAFPRGTVVGTADFPGTYSNAAQALNELKTPGGGDFESQFLQLTAVSNLITTRSDTFTAYIVVEGWENAGTLTAKRVFQRRYAYNLDRSSVAVGLPTQILDGTTPNPAAADTSVVQPYTGATPKPRVINTDVRAVAIPVPNSGQ